MAANLPPIPDHEKISPSIIRILGGNPSKFTLQGSNTYLLGSGPERILLDTGEGEAVWRTMLEKVLKDENTTVSTCLLSHWHHDHVGGVKDLLQTLGSSQVSKLELWKNRPDLNPDGILDTKSIRPIENGQRFSIGSSNQKFEVEALYCPGHAEDHMAFVITESPHKSEIGSIFTGDNVLGHGTAVFEDLSIYLHSLSVMKQRISEETSQTKKAYPGHGVVIDDAEAKIAEYIQHRRLRETEALNVLMYGTTKSPASQVENAKKDPLNRETSSADGNATKADASLKDLVETPKEFVPGKEWSSMEMVKVIYAAYPESLHQPAERGLLQVLDKLKKDGTIEQTKDGKWRAIVNGGQSTLTGKSEGKSSL